MSRLTSWAARAVSGAGLLTLLALPAPQPAQAQSQPAQTNWNGIYLGGALSYGWMNSGNPNVSSDWNGDGVTVNLHRHNRASNFGGAVFLGYNHKLTDSIVIGIEADTLFNRLRSGGSSSRSHDDQIFSQHFFGTPTQPTEGTPDTITEVTGWICVNNGGGKPAPKQIFPTDDISQCPNAKTWTMQDVSYTITTPGTAPEKGSYWGADFTGTLTNFQDVFTAEKNIYDVQTARFRAGFLVTPSVMVYATGGLAAGHVSAKVSRVQSGTYSGSFENAPQKESDLGGSSGNYDTVSPPADYTGSVGPEDYLSVSQGSYKGYRLSLIHI